MILLSNLHKLVELGVFSMAFVEESGAIVAAKDVICTSWHSKGRTLNIKFIESKEVRTVRRCTIIAYQDEEVAL